MIKLFENYEIKIIEFINFKPKEIVESPGVYFLIYPTLIPYFLF